MLLGLLLAIGAFFSVTLLGIPFVPLLGGLRRWRPYAPLDAVREHKDQGDMMLFDSVEDQMEDFSLKWPSEVSHRAGGLTELPWPSEGWDDPAFGAQARIDYANLRERNAISEENARQGGLAPQSDQQRRSDAKRKRQSDPAPRQAAPRRSPTPPVKTAKPQPEYVLHGAPTPVPASVSEKKKNRPKITPKPAPRREASSPDQAEVAKMVKELGLAGAVEKIRVQTGWDFKKSAQYLATVLKDRS